MVRQSSASCFHRMHDIDLYRSYVGAPRALLARQRLSTVNSNSTESQAKGRLFGNIYECPNGTHECRPILIESELMLSTRVMSSCMEISSICLGELSQAMPSFDNVLDDAWLGSSLVATSDDSLVVRNRCCFYNETHH
jgi:hypothetical protein